MATPAPRLFVKPRAGLKVREPNPPFAPLPPFGKSVEDDSFWHRRLGDNDVELTTEAEIEAGAAAAAAAAPK